jgi:hypothetical protein
MRKLSLKAVRWLKCWRLDFACYRNLERDIIVCVIVTVILKSVIRTVEPLTNKNGTKIMNFKIRYFLFVSTCVRSTCTGISNQYVRLVLNFVTIMNPACFQFKFLPWHSYGGDGKKCTIPDVESRSSAGIWNSTSTLWIEALPLW